MSAQRDRYKESVAERKKEIAVEEAKLRHDKQAEQEERRQKLERAKASQASAEERVSAINDEMRVLEPRISACRQALTEAKSTADTAYTEIRNCPQQLDKLNAQSYRAVDAFGKNLMQVLDRINKMKWHGQRPVGPLGLFVSLRNSSDQQWSNVMRIILGRTLASFAVTDARDREPLRKLLVESQKLVLCKICKIKLTIAFL